MTTSDFLRALEEALEVDQNSLQESQRLEDVEIWDSMAAMIFMALVDEETGLSVTGDQIMDCQTVGDLVGLLGDKIAA